MVDRRELKWFGHQIRLDSNRKHRKVWTQKLRGQEKRRAKYRMGTECMESEEKKEKAL
jgi:hypothetical protein